MEMELEKEKNLLGTTLLSVADAYDAMTTERTYRKALTKEEAANDIKDKSGKQFDPDYARIFVEKILKME